MHTLVRGLCLGSLISMASGNVLAQNPQNAFTWQEVKDRFEQANPTLRAGQIGIDESRAQEITAYLRPNPQGSLTLDQMGHTTSGSPFSDVNLIATASYLDERRHKRELRLESAQSATRIAGSGQADLERGLLFSLRGAFVGTLQAKAVLRVVKDNLAYWDQVLDISRTRFQAGDIAQIDLDRLELQRVQFESDVQTAEVNLRTAKIQLLMLLNDRTPVEWNNST